MVRTDKLRARPRGPAVAWRATRSRASAALGQLGVDLIVAQSVAAIRKAVAEQR